MAVFADMGSKPIGYFNGLRLVKLSALNEHNAVSVDNKFVIQN